MRPKLSNHSRSSINPESYQSSTSSSSSPLHDSVSQSPSPLSVHRVSSTPFPESTRSSNDDESQESSPPVRRHTSDSSRVKKPTHGKWANDFFRFFRSLGSNDDRQHDKRKHKRQLESLARKEKELETKTHYVLSSSKELSSHNNTPLTSISSSFHSDIQSQSLVVPPLPPLKTINFPKRSKRKRGSYHAFNRLSVHPGHRIHVTQSQHFEADSQLLVPPESETISASFENAWHSLQYQMSKTWTEFTGPTLAEVPDNLREQIDQPPIGFTFSPAGLLLPYHFGVAECLRHFEVLTPSTPIAGASAGALAVAVLACDVPISSSMRVIYQVEENLRDHGAARRLHSVLLKQLDELLPPDAHDCFNRRDGRACVSYTQVWPFPKGQFAANFTSLDDLRDCLVASCNIPFYFSKWPTVNCRGFPCVDGYFAVSRSNFGCPKTTAARDIRILPFPAKAVHVVFPEGDYISPDLEKFDELLNDATEGQFQKEWKEYCESYPAPLPPTSKPLSGISPTVEQEAGKIEPKQNDDPSPEQRERDSKLGMRRLKRMWGIGGLFSSSTKQTSLPSSSARISMGENSLPGLPTLQYSVHELLQIALDAADDEIAVELYDLGRADAFRWIRLEAMKDRGRITLVGKLSGNGTKSSKFLFGPSSIDESSQVPENANEVVDIRREEIIHTDEDVMRTEASDHGPEEVSTESADATRTERIDQEEVEAKRSVNDKQEKEDRALWKDDRNGTDQVEIESYEFLFGPSSIDESSQVPENANEVVDIRREVMLQTDEDVMRTERVTMDMRKSARKVLMQQELKG